MYSTRQIFLYFLILNTLQVFQNDFISAGSTSSHNFAKHDLEDLYKLTGRKKPSVDYIFAVHSIGHQAAHARRYLPPFFAAKAIRTAILVTLDISEYLPKPMTFFAALNEPCLVNRTDNLFQHTLTNPVIVSTMTANAFGSKIFECYSYSLAWDTHTGNPWNMEAQIVYKNIKYTSIGEALQNPNGVTLINIPIGTRGNVTNLEFVEYDRFIKTKLKEPGSWATIRSAPTYLWFAFPPIDGTYTTFQTEYTDPISGQSGNASAAVISFYPLSIFISKNQFSTFAAMGDKSGQLSQNLKRLSPENQHEGIVVVNLPA